MMDELNKFEKQPVVESHKNSHHIMKMHEDNQCWHETVTLLVTVEVAFGVALGCDKVISGNSDGTWSGCVSKCSSLEPHKYRLNHVCAIYWLCDPRQVN